MDCKIITVSSVLHCRFSLCGLSLYNLIKMFRKFILAMNFLSKGYNVPKIHIYACILM